MAGASDIRAGRAFVELTLKNDAFIRALRNSSQRLKDFGSGMMVAGAAITAAGLAVKGFLGFAVGKFAESAEELDKMSKRTGISATALSELAYAARQSGQDIDVLETSVKKMQKTIGTAMQGNKEAATALSRLGLTAAELKGKSPDKQFEMIGDAIAKIQDPTLRATLAMQIFGKSGTALLPLMGHIAELRKEAKDLGLSKSGESVAMGAALAEAFKKFHAVVNSIVGAIGSALAPAMLHIVSIGTNLAKVVADWVRSHSALISALSLTASGLIAVGAAVSVFGMGMKLAGIALGIIPAALSLIVGLIGAVLSPIGLVVAALTAAATYWFKFTESGQQAGSAIMGVLRTLGGIFTETFGGIMDAIESGDWATAGKIAVTGLQLALMTGWDAIKAAALSLWPTIQNAWTDSLNFILDAVGLVWLEIQDLWTSAQTGLGTAALRFFGWLGDLFASALEGIKIVWNTVWTGIENFFARTIAGLLDSLAKFVGAIPGAHEALVAFMGADERDWSKVGDNLRAGIDGRNKALADSQKQTADNAANRKQQTSDAVKLLQDRDKQLKKQRQDDYLAAVGARQKQPRANENPHVTDPNIAKTKADLDKLTGDAKTKHDQMVAEQEQKKKDFTASVGGTGDEAAAASKQSTFGTFSAAGLVAGAGGGTFERVAKNTENAAKHAEKTAKHAEKMAADTREIKTTMQSFQLA